MLSTVKEFEQLPLVLKVDEMAQVLGISRKLAYQLVRRDGFPAVRVGKKRLVIPRDRLIQWLNENAEKAI